MLILFFLPEILSDFAIYCQNTVDLPLCLSVSLDPHSPLWPDLCVCFARPPRTDWFCALLLPIFGLGSPASFNVCLWLDGGGIAVCGDDARLAPIRSVCASAWRPFCQWATDSLLGSTLLLLVAALLLCTEF